MTTLGKILVFLNLVFSVLVGALIVMVFMRSTNWAAGYKDEHRQKEGLLVTLQNVQQAKADLEKAKNEDLDRVQGQVADLAKQKDMADKVRQDAEAKTQVAEAQANADRLTVQKVTSAMEAMKVEIKTLDERLAEQQQTVLKLGLQNKDYKAESIQAKTNLEAALQRNKMLLDKLIEKDRLLAAAQGDAAAKLGREQPNPPPDDVRGRVTATDDGTGWITINLGSDSGLNKGNTLEIYRLKPRPTYLGTFRVYDVKPHEAVGKLIGAGVKGRVQKDDEVASKIP